MEFDDIYSKTPDLFGQEAQEIVCSYMSELSGTGPILDIGAGQGRNTFFLARAGYPVVALEPSGVACKMMDRVAEDEKLSIETVQEDFETFVPKVVQYNGMLAIGLIPCLRWQSIFTLQDRIRAWTGPGSLIWLTGFTTDDPAFPDVQEKRTSIGDNSFEWSTGMVRTYLEPGQIISFFPEMEVIHHWEGLGRWHRHGDSEQERHGKFEVVLGR